MGAVSRASATDTATAARGRAGSSPSEPADVVEGLWRGILIFGACLTLEGVGLLVVLSVGASLGLFDFTVTFVIGLMVCAYIESTDGVNAFGAATLVSIVVALYFSLNPGHWGYLPGSAGSVGGWWAAGSLQVVGLALVVFSLARMARLNAESLAS